MTTSIPATTRVLTIGLHPSALDYNRAPDLDEAALTARIESANRSIREAGFDAVSCSIGTSPDEVESTIRDHLATGSFGLAMIGAGVRLQPNYTELFERIINVLHDAAPDIRFCFNTSPETTADALRRWIQPSSQGIQ
jgi:hypothetical protein